MFIILEIIFALFFNIFFTFLFHYFLSCELINDLILTFFESIFESLDFLIISASLLVKDLECDCDSTFFVRKLETVREKVQENLEVPSLISVNQLDHVQIFLIINFCSKFYVIIVGVRNQYLESLVNCGAQIEIFLRK